MSELSVPLQNPSSLFQVPVLISSKICVSRKCWQLVSAGFPGGAVVKNLPADAGDAGDVRSISGSGRSPGEGNCNPLQYACLGNPMDRSAWRAIVLVGHKESDTTEHSDKHSSVHITVTKYKYHMAPAKTEAGKPVHRQKYLGGGGEFITKNIITSHIYCQAKSFPGINSFNPLKTAWGYCLHFPDSETEI